MRSSSSRRARRRRRRSRRRWRSSALSRRMKWTRASENRTVGRTRFRCAQSRRRRGRALVVDELPTDPLGPLQSSAIEGGTMKSRAGLLFFEAVFLLAAFLHSGTAWSAEASSADAWPQHPVKVVVPVGPGSGADVAARLVADQLSRRWGQAVVVENRPGADGIVGVAAFIAAADDHALLFAPTGTFTASPLVHQNVGLHSDRLAPIARVSSTIIAIAAPASLNVSSLAELMTLVRSQPGRFQ